VETNALIFDFDGLLMDTETTLLQSWQREWRAYGLELELEGFFADHGGDVNQQRYLTLGRAVGPTYNRSISDARRVAYRDEVHAVLGLAPGISAWLDRAEVLGLRLAIASSSPTEWVRDLLKGSGYLEKFEVLACGDEVSAHKPDPAVYLLALERLGLSSQRAIAFEDTPHGVAAAQAAGLRCVAVPNAFAAPDRFAAAELVLPSATAATLDQILALKRVQRR
jgi:HAD superfamily hydrolase (TIGR01509 family)